MILEVVDAGGVRTRLWLESLPLTVGRGFANDLVLDDPYVDARHARIAADETGALVVEDLGSLNGLATPGSPHRAARLVAGPGTEVRVGRTLLRFRDPDEAVPPALPYREDEVRPVSDPPRWASGGRARLAVSAAALAAIAVYAWLGSYERSSASDVVSAVLGFGVAAAAWAGIWALAGRMAGQRSHFGGHFALASAAVLAGLAFGTVDGWAGFLYPDNPVSAPAWLLFGLAMAAALVAGHLALASALPARRRWRAGLVTAGAFFFLAAVSVLAEDDEFSDVPEFSGVLKPVPDRWVPTSGTGELDRMAAELKEQVDELAAEE
ncbi:MAG TPA: FHA domain-containing protein [Longimicrobiaceae bacterium]|nr:FHA domain-containing protein [Longimicrobiaceae bacterium]